MEQNEYKQAEAEFKSAIGKNPKYALAYFGMGELYYIQGEKRLAKQYLQQGLEQEPQNQQALKLMKKL